MHSLLGGESKGRGANDEVEIHPPKHGGLKVKLKMVKCCAAVSGRLLWLRREKPLNRTVAARCGKRRCVCIAHNTPLSIILAVAITMRPAYVEWKIDRHRSIGTQQKKRWKTLHPIIIIIIILLIQQILETIDFVMMKIRMARSS